LLAIKNISAITCASRKLGYSSQKQFSTSEQSLTVPVEMIQRRIYLMRGQKVMFDADLAELYEVSTGNLNLAVRRNPRRFPDDFMFQLTKEEFEDLRL
jgi:hypothetical protein